MRSRLISRAPAFSVMPIMRPSTCAGTPATMCFGGSPRRFGQFCRTSSWLPPMPPEATMTAWARRLKSPITLREELTPRCADRLENGTADAVDGAVGNAKRIDPVAELEGEQSARLRFPRAPFERLDHAGAGSPADMKARHRIAMAQRIVAAALGPADHRENPVAHRAQPAAFFAGGKGHIGFRPALRPMIFVAVETRGTVPILQREFERVLDAEAALFRRVHQEQSAERPKCLAA